MRLVLIASLSLGSMVRLILSPAIRQGFAFGVSTPNKYASLAVRKPRCRLWSSKLNSASFGQNLNIGPLKRAQAKRNRIRPPQLAASFISKVDRWHIASFRCPAEFCRYRGIADIDQARFMSTWPGQLVRRS